MSSKCGLKLIFTSIILIVIVNGYAKDISRVERGHNRLNEYISHYETLNYDHKHIRASHNRAKRSVTKDQHVDIKFRAHGRDFHLRLKRDLKTFSDKLEIYDSNNSPIDDISTDHIYVGQVIGDPKSYVFGSILHDGVFEGKIITERDAYYVEHAKRYFNNDNNNNKNNNNNNYKTNNNSNNNSNNNNNDATKHYPQALKQSATTSDLTDESDEKEDGDVRKVASGIFTGTGNNKSNSNSHVEQQQQQHYKTRTTTTKKTTSTAKTNTTTTSSTTMRKTEATVLTTPSKNGKSRQHETPKVDADSSGGDGGAGSESGGGIGFHSVIYKDSHVDDVYEDLREGHVGGCGITDEVSQWMENIQNSAVEELPEPMSKDVDIAQKLQKKRTTTTTTTTMTRTVNTATRKNNDDHDNEDILTVVAAGSIVDLNVGENNAPAAISKNKISKKSTTTTMAAAALSTMNSSSIPHPPKKYKSHSSSHSNGGGSGSHHHNNNKQSNTHNHNNNNNNNHNNNDESGNNNHHNNGANDDFKFPHQKYTKEANFRATFYDPETGRKYEPEMNDDWHERVHERVRRASGSSNASGRREDNKNTCSLYIQTDPLIWRHIREGIADHDKGNKNSIDLKTREEITSLIAHHVTAVNYIYRNTKFDGRTEHRNIRFEVQRIKIDDDSACRNSYNGPHNAFCNEHMDVSNFLNLHSLEDHSLFCLAYVFTYRDFTGGTLGLAWVASASGASGGICEKFKTYTETVGGQYQSTKRSLNTGIITFVNYNSRVPPKVSQLTLAHEIGHNFGSPHDYPQECRPGGLNGNFIMFASATSGDRPNNSKFSPCSIRNISNVLDVLVGNPKRDCFKASEGAFCGNKIVEVGEECDCGFNEDECKDVCCYPRIISEYDLSINSSAKGCARRARTQCSPSQGPCCQSGSCTFVSTHQRQKCKEETECSWSSTCNGTTAECPDPKPRDDKTKCNNGTALCIRGECSGSICLLWNMSECFLTSQATPHVDKRKLCELACQNGNDTSTCRSTSEFAHIFGLPPGGISLRPGSPCDNFQGYCDVFLKCRAVDADGPLVRLKNLLLNRETLLTVAQWVTENWYVVVLIGIAFILVMGVFIKCCAVHTPSSNPKKRRARRISETLRAPMNTLRRMRHPHGRGAGPRSIPPPVHDGRSHHHRSGHPSDWDRRDPRHAAAPHAGRAVAVAGRPAGRSSRAPVAAGRPPSSSRAPPAGHHGYADGVGPPPATAPGYSGVVANNNMPASSSSRTQMPLPLPPPGTAAGAVQVPPQTQQLPPQQQAYYAPKEPRNRSRSSRSSSSPAGQKSKTKDSHKKQQQQQSSSSSTSNNKQPTKHKRRNIVY